MQWFSLGEIRHVSNNPPVTHALRSQPIDFMNYLFVEGRPLIELIDCDTTFINPHTAKYYPVDRKQMPRYKKAKGIEVEQVPNTKIKLNHTKETWWAADHAWCAGNEPGAPCCAEPGSWNESSDNTCRILPANVGQVAENKPGENLSFRQRFELHRSEAACAACHDKIDPLGFSLGAYDSGGGYMKSPGLCVDEGKGQEKEQERIGNVAVSIDTSGQLPSGETFEDFQELKQILVTQQRERVIRNIVQRMMAYALCRKLEAYDGPTVEAIVKDLYENNGTFHDLIHKIAGSLPFRQTVVRSSSHSGDTQP